MDCGVQRKMREKREWETQRANQGEGAAVFRIGLELRKKHLIYTCFFFNVGLVEPVRFGSISFRL
jgi:hypothetical protein